MDSSAWRGESLETWALNAPRHTALRAPCRRAHPLSWKKTPWKFPHCYSSSCSPLMLPCNIVQFNYLKATRGGIGCPPACRYYALRKSFANPAQLQLINPLFSLNTSPPMKRELCTICSGIFYGDHKRPPPLSQPPSLYPSIKSFIRFASRSRWGAVRPSLEVRKPFHCPRWERRWNKMAYRGHVDSSLLSIHDRADEESVWEAISLRRAPISGPHPPVAPSEGSLRVSVSVHGAESLDRFSAVSKLTNHMVPHAHRGPQLNCSNRGPPLLSMHPWAQH